MGFSHDPIGNRLTATEGAQTDSYAANALNEYANVRGVAHSYDEDGNLTSDGTRRFVYDAENRLVLVEPLSAANGSERVRMAYDYLGRRVQKVVEEFDGSAWAQQDDVRFVYMGWNVIEERRTSAGVTTKKNFVWGLDLSQSMDGAGGIGGLLTVVDEAGSQMAFLYDANGNVGQLVDEQGSVVARYEYDPFGNVIVADGAAANDNAYRFSTKYADQETELVYYGYRFYDTGLGRWTQRDPAQEDAGGLNLHAAFANDPVNGVDLYGLLCRRVSSANGRTLVKCDACDRLENLHEVGPFEVQEYEKWLRAEDGKPLPGPDSRNFGESRVFSIPNTVFLLVGDPGLESEPHSLHEMWAAGPIRTAAWLSAAGFALEGRDVVVKTRATIDDARAAFGSADTYGIFYQGHGPRMLMFGEVEGFSPSTARDWLHHGLAELMVMGCSSATSSFACGYGWDALVVKDGTFIGVGSVTNLFTQRFQSVTRSGTYTP